MEEHNPNVTTVQIQAGLAKLTGDLAVPEHSTGAVLFAHGSGSSRHSPRNQYVAHVLREAGLATLLLDLLTTEEESFDRQTGQLRFDIQFLAERLLHATYWFAARREVRAMKLGYFGASTGAGAALVAAAEAGDRVHAIVSRGGRPDMAGSVLARVQAPTLLIVGGRDEVVIKLNREAFSQLLCEKKLEIVPGATHLFEEPGTLEAVARLACEWFNQHLG